MIRHSILAAMGVSELAKVFSLRTRLPVLAGLLWMTACSGGSGDSPPDAATGPADSAVPAIDAGPKTYESAADFPMEGCQAGSLDGLMVLGKWHNVPGDGSQEFDSYFLDEMGVFKGILDSIPANGILFDGDNLFLHRQLNLSSMGVNLCAVEPDGRLRGHMARCNGLDCTVTTVVAELIEPVTQ